MIQIDIFKNNKFSHSALLNNRDAKKFINKFEGTKEFPLGKDHPMDFDMDCTYPVGYSLNVYNRTNEKRGALKRVIDLMDGDL